VHVWLPACRSCLGGKESPLSGVAIVESERNELGLAAIRESEILEEFRCKSIIKCSGHVKISRILCQLSSV